MKSNKGFTLVELIVVIAILALLSSLAVSAFTGIMGQAQDASRRQAANTVASALNAYNAVARANGNQIVADADDGPLPVTADGFGIGFNGGGVHTAATGFLNGFGVSWSMDEPTWRFITGQEPAGGNNLPRLSWNDTTRIWTVRTQ